MDETYINVRDDFLNVYYAVFNFVVKKSYLL